jgi:hypothetical protein
MGVGETPRQFVVVAVYRTVMVDEGGAIAVADTDPSRLQAEKDLGHAPGRGEIVQVTVTLEKTLPNQWAQVGRSRRYVTYERNNEPTAEELKNAGPEWIAVIDFGLTRPVVPSRWLGVLADDVFSQSGNRDLAEAVRRGGSARYAPPPLPADKAVPFVVAWVSWILAFLLFANLFLGWNTGRKRRG